MAKAVVLVPVTLLPIINPLSTAPVFVATLRGDPDAGKRLARQVAINSWIVIVASMLIGTYVLALFGISLPVVRVAGGLLVAATGWRMLHSIEQDDVHAAAVEKTVRLSDAEIVRRSFLPLTFPLTTGPGTIAAAIALGAQIPSNPVLFFAGAAAVGLGAAVVAVLLFLIFANAAAVLRRLGPIGTLVMMRLMAFILLCVGIQIMWTGFAELTGIGT
jgi:multiple antibiotic resistance protein